MLNKVGLEAGVTGWLGREKIDRGMEAMKWGHKEEEEEDVPKERAEEACPHVLTLMGQYLIIWNSRAVFCSQGCSSLLEHLQGRQVIKL